MRIMLQKDSLPFAPGQELLTTLIDSVEEGIVVADRGGRVLFANEALRRLVGQGELRLSQLGGSNLALAIKRAQIAAGFEDAVSRRQEGFLEFDHTLELAGMRRHFRIRTGVVNSTHGAEWRLLILKDITQVRELEAKAGVAPEGEFTSNDVRMREVIRQIRQVAQTAAYVLLQGESGTGKSMLARLIHRLSPRAAKPFVEVNCAAIPESLLESELFGHVKGAFTGASSDRPGRFAAADGGTLFLDEVGELPLHVQAKLLRAVQEQRFEAVGSNRTHTVDVRIVAASNRFLKEAVETRQFRADLYYRLAVFPIYIPALRERKADIPLFISRFLERLSDRGYPKTSVSDSALRMLLDYPWPGNVRELENAIEHAVICADAGRIERHSLPQDIRAWHGQAPAPARLSVTSHTPPAEQLRGQILFALKRCQGRKTEAARMLGMDRVTLWRHMKRLGL